MTKSTFMSLIVCFILLFWSFVSFVEALTNQLLLKFCVSMGLIIVSLVLIAYVLSTIDTDRNHNID